jgi:hypothetical protein
MPDPCTTVFCIVPLALIALAVCRNLVHRFPVNRPVLAYSNVIKASTAEGVSIRVIVRLVLTVTDKHSYKAAVADRRLEAWCDGALTDPVAAVVSHRTVRQLRESREDFARRVATEVAAILEPGLGLALHTADLVRASAADTTSPFALPSSAMRMNDFIRPDPLGKPGPLTGHAFGWDSALTHIRHHGQQARGRVKAISKHTESRRSVTGFFETTTSFWVTAEFECNGSVYTCQQDFSTRPLVSNGDPITVRYCPYYPRLFAKLS